MAKNNILSDLSCKRNSLSSLSLRRLKSIERTSKEREFPFSLSFFKFYFVLEFLVLFLSFFYFIFVLLLCFLLV